MPDSRARLARLALVAAAWCALPPAAALLDAQPQPASASIGAGLIVGRVVDGDGSIPLAGAIVSLAGPAQPSPVLTTSDGYYLFRDLPRGLYTVSARKGGYTAGRPGQRRPDGPASAIRLDDGQRLGAPPVRLWRFGAITGVVVDEAGEPQVGVSVRALRRMRPGSHWRFGVAGISLTDDRGVYRLGTLPPGDYLVSVAARSIPIPVDDVSGAAPAGSHEPGPARSATPLRDSRGHTPPRGSREAIYPTTFNPDALTPGQAQPVTVRPGHESPGVDVRLTPLPSYRITGIVLGPGGPVAGAEVDLLPDALGNTLLGDDVTHATTTANGEFSLTAPIGQYQLRTTTGGVDTPGTPRAIWWASAPVGLRDEDVGGITLLLHEGLAITGRVELEGIGREATTYRGRIVIQRVDDGPGEGDVIGVQTNGRGEFTSPGLVPGRYFVQPAVAPPGWNFRATFADGIDVSDVPLDLTVTNAEVVVTFTEARTAASGTVRAASGQPDPAALVVLFPMNPRAWDGTDYAPRRMRSTLVNAAGGWTIAGLPAGDYYVAAVADAEATGWEDPDTLLALSSSATRLSIREGEQRTIDLRTQAIR